MASITKSSIGIIAAAAVAALAALPFATRLSSEQAEEGDPAKGRLIALENCASCHAVEPGATSPVAEAPPFETFSQMWPVEYLEEALAEGIMVGHEDYQMPVFQFTTEDIAHLIAYLKSIQTDPHKDDSRQSD